MQRKLLIYFFTILQNWHYFTRPYFLIDLFYRLRQLTDSSQTVAARSCPDDHRSR